MFGEKKPGKINILYWYRTFLSFFFIFISFNTVSRLKIKWKDESIDDTFFYSLAELKSHVNSCSCFILNTMSNLVIIVSKFLSNGCVF